MSMRAKYWAVMDEDGNLAHFPFRSVLTLYRRRGKDIIGQPRARVVQVTVTWKKGKALEPDFVRDSRGLYRPTRKRKKRVSAVKRSQLKAFAEFHRAASGRPKSLKGL